MALRRLFFSPVKRKQFLFFVVVFVVNKNESLFIDEKGLVDFFSPSFVAAASSKHLFNVFLLLSMSTTITKTITIFDPEWEVVPHSVDNFTLYQS